MKQSVPDRSALPVYQTGELFCGAGGLSRGFHSLGFKSCFANDIWAPALHTFLMNFDPVYAASNGKSAGEILELPGSVEDIDPKTVLKSLNRPPERYNNTSGLDVLLGGPPCQGFSVNSHIRSAKDPRNQLFREYIRLLYGLSPKVFVLENVPGMLSLAGGRFFDELRKGASGSKATIGYDLEFKILNAAHYGVPQERFRIVVIGTRRDVADVAGKVLVPEPEHYSFAQAHFKGGRTHTFHYAIGHGKALSPEVIPLFGELRPPITVQEAIDDLPALQNGGGEDQSSYASAGRPVTAFQKKMREGARRLFNHWCRELAGPNTERVKYIPPGGDWRDIPRHLLPPGMQRALRKDHTTRYGRFSGNDLSGTVLTKPDPHWGTFLHYDVTQQRLISVREAARIQSFPDSHVFYGSQVDQYKLCGNAVPPLLARAIAAKVQGTLDAFYARSVSNRGSRKARA